LILLGMLVGLLSSVIPYSFEMVALRTLPSRVFGILMSLEPAMAALIGLVVLHESLHPSQWIAVLCVVAASAGATRGASPTRPTRGARGARGARPTRGAERDGGGGRESNPPDPDSGSHRF